MDNNSKATGRLTKPVPQDPSREARQDATCDAHRCFPSGFFSTLHHVASLAWPIAFTQFSMFLFTYMSTPFVGRIGKDALAAVGISSAIANVFGNSVLIGLFTACETLVSQAYGKGDFKSIGVVCQQSLWVGLLACAPIIAVVLNVANLFRFFPQNEEVTRLVESYLYVYLPTFPLTVVYMALLKFLQCQLIVMPGVVACLISTIINALLHYIFIMQLSMSVVGAALSVVITSFIFALLLFVYILHQRLHVGIWDKFSVEAFMSWKNYLKLGWPGMIMVGLQFWAFEIGTVACALLDETNLASSLILLQIVAFAFTVFSGFATATSIAVGQALGGGSPDSAKTVSNVSFVLSISLGTITLIVFTAGQNLIPMLFTNIPEVLGLIVKVMPVCAAFQLMDSVANFSSGVIRGCGHQKIGAILNFLSYYIVSLPIGLTLLAPSVGGLGVMGFWIGQLAAQTVQSIAVLIFQFAFIDWTSEWRAALARVSEFDTEAEASPGEAETRAKVHGTAALNDAIEEIPEDAKENDTINAKTPPTTALLAPQRATALTDNSAGRWMNNASDAVDNDDKRGSWKRRELGIRVVIVVIFVVGFLVGGGVAHLCFRRLIMDYQSANGGRGHAGRGTLLIYFKNVTRSQ